MDEAVMHFSIVRSYLEYAPLEDKSGNRLPEAADIQMIFRLTIQVTSRESNPCIIFF